MYQTSYVAPTRHDEVRATSYSPHMTQGRDVDDTLGRRIATLIRTARHRLQWSQEKLAEEAGVDRQTIIRYESGRSRAPDPIQFRRVCHALGITPLDAAIALGYVTREEVNAAVPLPADIAEAAELLTDPAIPVDQKTYMINYLRWLRDNAEPQNSDGDSPRHRAAGS